MTGITITGGITFEGAGGITINPPGIVTDGILLNFDAATYSGSGDWIDSHAGVPAAPQNNPVWSSDNGGTFVLSAPSTQYFTVPWPTFQPTYTIDIWFNLTGDQPGGAPCLISDEFTGAPFNFTINAASNQLQTGWYTTNWPGQYATDNIPTGLTHDGSTWYNITMAVGASEYRDYINGAVSYAPGNFGGGTAPNGSSPTQQFFIGKRWDQADTVNAKIAVVNIYDRALTDAEVLQNYNFYHSRFVTPPATVPTLDITAHNFPSNNPTGSITFDITSDGGSPVLETGVIYGLPGQTIYASSVDTCEGTSSTAERTAIRDGGCPGPYTTGLTGSQSINFNTFQFVIHGDTINVLAYARNSVGVAYSPTVLSWTPGICLAEGTAITLADGTAKAVEDIVMTDLIRVWDFDNGITTSAMPLWIKCQESTTQYNLLTFSDGSTLKTISQHRIFNKEAGAFTYPMTADTPIGTTTVNVNGDEVTLVNKCVMFDTVNYYNVITQHHLNLYADGILTSMRYNNIYPIVDMKFVKDDRQLRGVEEFILAGIDQRWIDGLRLQEQTIAVEDIKWYTQRLEYKEAGRQTIDNTKEELSWH